VRAPRGDQPTRICRSSPRGWQRIAYVLIYRGMKLDARISDERGRSAIRPPGGSKKNYVSTSCFAAAPWRRIRRKMWRESSLSPIGSDAVLSERQIRDHRDARDSPLPVSATAIAEPLGKLSGKASVALHWFPEGRGSGRVDLRNWRRDRCADAPQ